MWTWLEGKCIITRVSAVGIECSLDNPTFVIQTLDRTFLLVIEHLSFNMAFSKSASLLALAGLLATAFAQDCGSKYPDSQILRAF